MKTLTLRVSDPVGIHARPAGIAVTAAMKSKCDVRISYNGLEASMKSIIRVMALGIPNEADFTITCNGEDEESAINSIEKALKEEGIVY